MISQTAQVAPKISRGHEESEKTKAFHKSRSALSTTYHTHDTTRPRWYHRGLASLLSRSQNHIITRLSFYYHETQNLLSRGQFSIITKQNFHYHGLSFAFVALYSCPSVGVILQEVQSVAVTICRGYVLGGTIITDTSIRNSYNLQELSQWVYTLGGTLNSYSHYRYNLQNIFQQLQSVAVAVRGGIIIATICSSHNLQGVCQLQSLVAIQ